MTTITAKPLTARPLTARPLTAYRLGESTEGANPLVWHAATPDSDGVMQAQLIGSGTPTFNVDAGLLLPDHEGIYRTTSEDTPPWHGARKVTNLLPQTNNMLGSRWATSLNMTVTLNSGGGPAGQDSWIYTPTVPTTNYYGVHSPTSHGATPAGRSVVFSFYARSRTGANTNITVFISATDNMGTKSITTSWQRFSFFGTLTSNGLPSIRSLVGEVETADWQLEDVSGQSNQNPSEFVENASSTVAAGRYYGYENGNTVSSNVVTEAQGATLDPLPSLYGAPAYTNSLAYSNQLDNAAWTKVIATVTANQAIGLAGAMDADEVSFAGGYIYNTTNIAGAAGQVVTCRIFVKAKNTATKIKVRIDRAGAAQGNQTDYDLNPTGYTEIIHTATLDGGTGTPVLRLDQPATGAGDAVYYIANTETHAARTAAQVRGSAPIITAASTVTTTAITDVHDSGNWVDTSGGLYCEVTLQVAQNILSTFLDVSGSTFRLNDGTNTVTAAWVTNTAYQLGIAWDAAAGTMAINVDGTWSSNATYDGTLLAGALDIFRSPAGVGLMRNLKRYSASNLAAAKALVDGDMP